VPIILQYVDVVSGTSVTRRAIHRASGGDHTTTKYSSVVEEEDLQGTVAGFSEGVAYET
jgi:hypothetical protein